MKSKIGNLKRREREKIVRKNEILTAALSVFAKKTYENATLGEIAEKAEYGKGTIYNYFKGKEDLFIKLMEHGTNQFEETIRKAIKKGGNCREQMRNVAKESLKFSIQNGDFFRVLLKEYGRLALAMKGNFKEQLLKSHFSIIQIVADVIRKGIENSEIKNINPKKTAEFFLHMTNELIWKNKCFDSKAVTKNDVDFLVSLFFDGIAVKN